MYVVYKVEAAQYPRTASGRWSTVACDKCETKARTERQQARATGDDEARFFKARRRWAVNPAGYSYCDRWTAPVAWKNDKRLIETATPVCIPDAACGTRERNIIGNASNVDYIEDAGHELYRFYLPRVDGGADTCTWDDTTRKFIG